MNGPRAFLLVALLGACTPRALKVDAVVDAAGEIGIDEGLVGLVIGVEQHGVRRVRGFGHARLRPDVPARADTVFEIGSITKQFTATLVMQLASEGKLRLDDGVPAAGGATVAQLLSHTAGVPNYLEIPGWQAAIEEDPRPERMLALAHDLPPRFAPGRHWEYSNTGYLILGQLVEKLDGRPWRELVRERLLRPIGLGSTFVCGADPAADHRAYAYFYDRTPAPRSPYLPAADGGLCSTADDLLTWSRALASGRVVAAADWTRMTTPARLSSGAATAYGFGLHVVERGGHRVIFHDGLVNNFRSTLERWPDDDLTVVVLSNTHGNLGGYLAMQIGEELVRGPTPYLALRLAYVHWRSLTLALLSLLALIVVSRRRAARARRSRTPDRP